MNLGEINKCAIFTVCNLAYLPKALVLAETVLRYNNTMLKVYLFDKKINGDFPKMDVDLVWIEDLGIEKFHQLAFKYDIIELSTSLKAYIALELFNKFEKVVFLDPDTCLFHSIEPIINDLEINSVVLTPHYTTPQVNDISESDLGMLRFGPYNLGFFAVKRTEQGKKFLEWWSERCMNLCFMESQFGLSVDQKWISIAQCFFHDIHVSFNQGYNVAAWNSWERIISKDANGSYIVNNKDPLVFFHFSNFDPKDPEYLNKRSLYEKGKRRPDFLELGVEYGKALEEKKNGLELTKYAYDYMSNGDYISPTLRRAYACIIKELPADHDPFDSKGLAGC